MLAGWGSRGERALATSSQGCGGLEAALVTRGPRRGPRPASQTTRPRTPLPFLHFRCAPFSPPSQAPGDPGRAPLTTPPPPPRPCRPAPQPAQRTMSPKSFLLLAVLAAALFARCAGPPRRRRAAARWPPPRAFRPPPRPAPPRQRAPARPPLAALTALRGNARLLALLWPPSPPTHPPDLPAPSPRSSDAARRPPAVVYTGKCTAARDCAKGNNVLCIAGACACKNTCKLYDLATATTNPCAVKNFCTDPLLPICEQVKGSVTPKCSAPVIAPAPAPAP